MEENQPKMEVIVKTHDSHAQDAHVETPEEQAVEDAEIEAAQTMAVEAATTAEVAIDTAQVAMVEAARAADIAESVINVNDKWHEERNEIWRVIAELREGLGLILTRMETMSPSTPKNSTLEPASSQAIASEVVLEVPEMLPPRSEEESPAAKMRLKKRMWI